MDLLSLPVAALFVVSMTAAFLSNVFKKSYNNRFPTAFDTQIYISAGGVAVLLTLFCASRATAPSLATVLLGCVFGAVTLAHSVCFMKAIETGSFAYTFVIVSLSTIIPAISGVLFWHEKITVPQIFGLIAFAACILLSVNAEGKAANGEKTKKKTWILSVSVCFVLSGLVGILQKIHQSSPYAEERIPFLAIAFGIMTVASAFGAYAVRKTRVVPRENKAKRYLLKYLLIAVGGIGVGLNNVINLYLSGVVESAVFFPVVNGGGLALTTLAGVIFFREKLTAKQWAGIAVGILSVLLLCF